MNSLSLVLFAAVGLQTATAQTYVEPKFSAPEIPVTRGVHTIAESKVGCATASATAPLARCEVNTDSGAARMNLLSLSGTLGEIAYQHGKLLAPEIQNGSLVEALDNIDGLKAKFKNKPVILESITALVACYVGRVKSSVDLEFQNATVSLAKGYIDGMKQRGESAKYSVADIETATYSIELGNIFTTIFDNFKHHKVKTIARVVRECGKPALKAGWGEILEQISEHAVAKTSLRHDFACTGAVFPPAVTKDKQLYHARNLEQTSMIESWNRNPVTLMIHERGFHKYVAFGTAGLIFPGGISGYNEKGIAVSTHQMEGTTYGSGYDAGTAAMGPYIQQRILREADSIASALKVAQSVKAFSAWTILVSDSKTGESASIEITSEGADISRHRKNQAMGQSNYFFLEKNQELQFHENYNSYLETIARVKVVETVGKRGNAGIEDVLSLLASHVDWFEGERSFGRSVSRVMNIMSTIASPTQNKIWVTLSDRFPSSQGFYLEMSVDFKTMSVKPGQAIRTRDYEFLPSWEKSFSEFQLAYRANHAGQKPEALAHLQKASALAKQDGIVDPAYQYLIGRFLLDAGKINQAIPYFEQVLNLQTKLHPLKVANVSSFLLYSYDRTGVCKKKPSSCRALIETAVPIYESILKGNVKSQYFPLAPGGYIHAKDDIEGKLKFLSKVLLHKKKIKIPSIDMRSVD